jgi:hypothetical protein
VIRSINCCCVVAIGTLILVRARSKEPLFQAATKSWQSRHGDGGPAFGTELSVLRTSKHHGMIRLKCFNGPISTAGGSADLKLINRLQVGQHYFQWKKITSTVYRERCCGEDANNKLRVVAGGSKFPQIHLEYCLVVLLISDCKTGSGAKPSCSSGDKAACLGTCCADDCHHLHPRYRRSWQQVHDPGTGTGTRFHKLACETSVDLLCTY